VLEAEVGQLGIALAGASIFGGRALQPLGVAARLDPGLAQGRQPLEQVDAGGGVGVGAGSVIDVDGRVLLIALQGAGGLLFDLARGISSVSVLMELKISLRVRVVRFFAVIRALSKEWKMGVY
jgi:hypothetical protein